MAANDDNSNENIHPTFIEDEIEDAYIDYAMSVIVGRALPDVRDGLKPVHRRILYTMSDLGLTPDGPHKKSARIVGECLGKYHPHGDKAVYDALVRMAQDFSLRYPLVNGQGNFGSLDGDSQAAMRYTEAKLSECATPMLQDIDEETIAFRSNFDDSTKEPVVLPSLLPNLLVNGSSGIAVGMATAIPPHNLNEVVGAILHRIDNPDCTVEELTEYIKGPDFPTGGIICNPDDLLEMYETGNGRVVLRSHVHEEDESLIFTDIPYGVNKGNVVESIANKVNEGKIEGIRDLRDESNREGIRIVVEMKKGYSDKVIKNQLYKYTQLQKTVGVKLLALDGEEPNVFSLAGLIDEYIAHRETVVTNRTQYRLDKAKDRAHLLEGYKVAQNNIEDVVDIIQNASSRSNAEDELIDAYEFTETQAKAVLDMRLSRLTSLAIDEIEEEYNELQGDIERYETILNKRSERLDVLRNELNGLRDEYGDSRRTTIEATALNVTKEDLIEEKDLLVLLTDNNYIKRINPGVFSKQHRGGKGVKGMQLEEDVHIQDFTKTTTHEHLLFFAKNGQCYWKKGYQLPAGSRRSKGKNIINVLKSGNDSIATILPVANFKENNYLVTVTKNGLVKRTELNEYSNPRRGGVIGATCPQNDQLQDAFITNGEQQIMLISKYGRAIRFDENDIRPTARSTQGVRGMKLSDDNDAVQAGLSVNNDSTIITLSENGYGKQVAVEEYRIQGRGGRGLKTVPDNVNISSASVVDEGDDLLISTELGQVMRVEVSEINNYSRTAKGVLTMKAGKDKIKKVTKI